MVKWPDNATEPTPENVQAMLQHIRCLEAMIDGMTKMKVKKFTYEPGEFSMNLQNEFLPMLANALVQLFESSGGMNYVSWQISTEKLGPLELILQRSWGKTPVQMATELKNEIDALRKQHGKHLQTKADGPQDG